MASLVGIVPSLCSCGVPIGRLQVRFEDLVKKGKSFNEAMVELFEEYEPKMCCRTQFLNPLRYIPDDTFDKRISDKDRFIYKSNYKPRNPL